jgi:hypothetical protein
MQNAQTGSGVMPEGEGGNGAGKAGSLMKDAKNAIGEAAAGLKSKAAGAADERKDTAAQTLGTVAGALRGAAQDLHLGEAAALGTYAESAAEQLDKVAGYLREKDLKGLQRDTETFARRHPELFLGGAFLAGILAARFLKSGRPDVPATAEGGFESEFGGGDAAAPQSYTGVAPTEPFNAPHFESTGGQ